MTLSTPLKRSRSQQLQPSLLTYSNSPDEAYVLAADANSDDDHYSYDDDDGEEDELCNRVSGFDAPSSHKRCSQQHKESIYSPSTYSSQRTRKSWTNGSSSSQFSLSSKLQNAKEAFASTRKSFHLSDSMAASLQHLRDSASRGHTRTTEASRQYSSPLNNEEQHFNQQKPQQQRRRAVSYPSKLTQLLPSMASLKQKVSAAAKNKTMRDPTKKRPPGWARYVGVIGSHSNQVEHESFCAYAHAIDASNQYDSP